MNKDKLTCFSIDLDFALDDLREFFEESRENHNIEMLPDVIKKDFHALEHLVKKIDSFMEDI